MLGTVSGIFSSPDTEPDPALTKAKEDVLKKRIDNGYTKDLKVTDDGKVLTWSDAKNKYLNRDEAAAYRKELLNSKEDISVKNEEIPLNDSRTSNIIDTGPQTLHKLMNITDPEERAYAEKAFHAAVTEEKSTGWTFSNFFKKWFTSKDYDALDQPTKRFRTLSDSSGSGDMSDFFPRDEDFDRAVNDSKNGVQTSTPKDNNPDLPKDNPSMDSTVIFDADETPKASSSQLPEES